MDLRTPLVISLVLPLLVVPTHAHALEHNGTQSPAILTSANSTREETVTCHCTTAPSPTPTRKPDGPSAPQVLVLTASWSGCNGVLEVRPVLPSNTSWSQVFYTEQTQRGPDTLLKSVCKQKGGCSNQTGWEKGELKPEGCQLNQALSTSETSCLSMRVRCSVKEEAANVAGQLQAYKTATVLLCCVLLVVAVIRFTRPTIEALQKRLSDRRQNRWVGPTQSHSVSYNRGKNTIKSSDPEKRLSYPALERLTVAGSREPSSNRSSYNF